MSSSSPVAPNYIPDSPTSDEQIGSPVPINKPELLLQIFSHLPRNDRLIGMRCSRAWWKILGPRVYQEIVITSASGIPKWTTESDNSKQSRTLRLDWMRNLSIYHSPENTLPSETIPPLPNLQILTHHHLSEENIESLRCFVNLRPKNLSIVAEKADVPLEVIPIGEGVKEIWLAFGKWTKEEDIVKWTWCEGAISLIGDLTGMAPKFNWVTRLFRLWLSTLPASVEVVRIKRCSKVQNGDRTRESLYIFFSDGENHRLRAQTGQGIPVEPFRVIDISKSTTSKTAVFSGTAKRPFVMRWVRL